MKKQEIDLRNFFIGFEPFEDSIFSAGVGFRTTTSINEISMNVSRLWLNDLKFITRKCKKLGFDCLITLNLDEGLVTQKIEIYYFLRDEKE